MKKTIVYYILYTSFPGDPGCPVAFARAACTCETDYPQTDNLPKLTLYYILSDGSQADNDKSPYKREKRVADSLFFPRISSLVYSLLHLLFLGALSFV